MPTTQPSLRRADRTRAGQSIWQPSADIMDHRLKPIPPGRDFFSAPPPEIGKVVTAWSSVKVGQNLWPLPVKLGVSMAVAGLIAGVVVPLLMRHGKRPPSRENIICATIAIAFVPAALGVAIALRRRRVSYVGEEGVALFATRGRREQAKVQIVRFGDVADLQFNEQRHHKGGVQVSTEFKLQMVDMSGRTIFRLAGNYLEATVQREPGSPYLIAVAIQRSWDTYLQLRAARLQSPA